MSSMGIESVSVAGSDGLGRSRGPGGRSSVPTPLSSAPASERRRGASALDAPSQPADRPLRKVSAGSVPRPTGSPVPARRVSPPPPNRAGSVHISPQRKPAQNRGGLAERLFPEPDVKAVGPFGAAVPVSDMFAGRQLRSYQTALHSALGAPGGGADALTALQNDIDPLLEGVDQYLQRPGAMQPAVVEHEPPGSLTAAQLDSLGEDGLRNLVSQMASRHIAPPRVHTSPPPPPRVKGDRDADQVVAELESRSLQKAARDMLEQQLEGMDVRRRALAAYYSGNHDMDFTDFLHDFVAAEAGARDPVSLVQLQTQAMVDPFVTASGLGIPETVDTTRVPPPKPLFPAAVPPEHDMAEDLVRELAAEGGSEWTPQGPVTKPRAPEPVWGAKRALLVGVTYQRDGAGYALPRAARAVHRMRAFLAERGFYGEQLLLTDSDDADAEPETLPTLANLSAALRWLVDGAKAGDSLFLYFAGRAEYTLHPGLLDAGGRPKETPHLLPCDHADEGSIDGDVLFEEIVRPLQEGVRLTCVVDCCGHGAPFELPYVLVAQDGSFRVAEGAVEKRGVRGQVVMLSCTRDPAAEQLLLEQGTAPASYDGALTDAFLDTISRGEGRPTYRELLVGLRSALRHRVGPFAHCACISATCPLDWQRSTWHLAAPQVSADDDPRLVEARQQTRDLQQELRSLEAAHDLAMEQWRQQEEERQREEARRREEEWEEECKRRREEEARQKEDLQRARRLHAERRVVLCNDDEALVRMRVEEEEAQARHRVARRHAQQAGGLLALERTLERSQWSRRASSQWKRRPEEASEPVVLGVRWQRGDEREQLSLPGAEAAASGVRDFEVIKPPRISPPSVLTDSRYEPSPASARTLPYAGPHLVSTPTAQQAVYPAATPQPGYSGAAAQHDAGYVGAAAQPGYAGMAPQPGYAGAAAHPGYATPQPGYAGAMQQPAFPGFDPWVPQASARRW